MYVPPPDPCAERDRQVCKATRKLALAVLRRLARTTADIEPRIRTIVATQSGAPWEYDLWRLHADDGRLLTQFNLLDRPGAAWGKVIADVSYLIRLADLRTHPPGYYYVHPQPDSRDYAILLPTGPCGPAPRTIGTLT
ncbi:hypothetical protein ACWFR1_22890 [Streptomyces sp. NPDC055103]